MQPIRRIWWVHTRQMSPLVILSLIRAYKACTLWSLRSLCKSRYRKKSETRAYNTNKVRGKVQKPHFVYNDSYSFTDQSTLWTHWVTYIQLGLWHRAQLRAWINQNRKNTLRGESKCHAAVKRTSFSPLQLALIDRPRNGWPEIMRVIVTNSKFDHASIKFQSRDLNIG